MAIIGEITDETLAKFIHGTSPDGSDSFLANNDPGTVLDITLSSPGGDVDTGIALYELLRTSEAVVRITGYGIVGSMGVLVFMAGDQRVLTPGTRVFLHPGSFASGIPENIFSVMAKVDEIKGVHNWYCEEIARRSGHDAAEIYKLCDKDSFFSAHHALEMGVATNILLYSRE